MKIRSKLITAFLTMTIFPIALIIVCTSVILNQRTAMLANSFQVDTDYKKSDIFFEPYAFFNYISHRDYETIREIIWKNPDQLLNMEFLNTSNEKLLARHSFLMVEKADRFYYIGDKAVFQSLSDIPSQSSTDKKTHHLTYIDPNTTSVVKELSFQFSDHTPGRVFLVTDFTKLLPNWGESVKEIVIAFLVSLFAAGSLFAIWIYRSILRPLSILHLATTQIGSGDLAKPIPIPSNDEIGQLCEDFEAMRIRLRKMLDDTLRSEENTREIISSISHDLKTPITSIKGYTEGILDGVADTPEKQKKYLQTIYAKANDIAYLIDELFLFSQVDGNNLSYHFVPVNLENFFADCIDDISLDLESQNVTIEYYNTVDTSTQVLIDTEQMKRVLHNIIENAVKYNNQPERRIAIRLEDMTPESADAFVQIQIEDNGEGISEKDLPYIFDRFYRTDASRNSTRGGSGLGLAIVQKIIADHGGTAWAESDLGVGSSIYFTLKKCSQ